MGKKFKVTIEVDPEAGEVTFRDEAGNERSLKSVMMFGGDAERGAYYLFAYGASADAAWAFKQGFLHAFRGGDPGSRNFYRQCACHIAQCLDPLAFHRAADAREILGRWTAEDEVKDTTH